MIKSALAALLFSTALAVTPALAQEAPALTAEQITAQNQAIADFGAAQQLQGSGDHAGVVAKMTAALPAIRDIAKRDPANVQNAGFLASALTMLANSQGALNNLDAVATIYEEAAPYWMQVYEADKANTGVRDTLVSILVNLGNFSLVKEDKVGATPKFERALTLVRAARAADPASAELANAEFASLVGLSQSTGDMAYIEQAKPIGEELRQKGTVNAANQPSVQAILGAD